MDRRPWWHDPCEFKSVANSPEEGMSLSCDTTWVAFGRQDLETTTEDSVALAHASMWLRMQKCVTASASHEPQWHTWYCCVLVYWARFFFWKTSKKIFDTVLAGDLCLWQAWSLVALAFGVSPGYCLLTICWLGCAGVLSLSSPLVCRCSKEEKRCGDSFI